MGDGLRRGQEGQPVGAGAGSWAGHPGACKHQGAGESLQGRSWPAGQSQVSRKSTALLQSAVCSLLVHSFYPDAKLRVRQALPHEIQAEK